ncbi:hypothetical protein GGR08_001210 [Bartonella fuyuanensis]|uniref:Uncharacterized protein n=1 Tax=Bartonella fuyuanensis TaxID=1460968 RepID=A0A840E527_9HYPH|nr:hypothetical protein [Bartonella fuyuanensis]
MILQIPIQWLYALFTILIIGLRLKGQSMLVDAMGIGMKL